jgi:hypothetical protein
LARHRRSRSKNRKYVGRHRAVAPESYKKQRLAVVVPLAASLVLYPTIAGDGSGIFPSLGIIAPFLDEEEANAEEVITETTEPVEDVVEDVVEEVDE